MKSHWLNGMPKEYKKNLTKEILEIEQLRKPEDRFDAYQALRLRIRMETKRWQIQKKEL